MFYTENEEELMALGERLAKHLDAGQVILLTGELGAGKTTLTKGLAKGLGITQMVKSPTYTLVRTYEGRLPLNHLDIYRLGDDPDSIDIDEFLYSDGVTVIEWGRLLPSDAIEDYLELVIERRDHGRQVSLAAFGQRSQALLEDFENGRADD
ncbi:tRNA (adenosine(37)-N6)-threonylcarbamoyltransferase complex ATPase subunit type 1 TsaE [Streptococcus entericus]|uniref:tRNA (adenosine(37)-N6)-threonylcarbamoyltransferase complex ATPase subunit type 1 TsaE n=1 Tax=Streptococcus entericus TaxID=155680 RepID=UPI00037CAFCB|nr:tRNA (adenosine(37)-N6)-threonylcarbamoyltransferase complex ATPase subunit type 1 TsaE [Streptococcus entericus]